MKIKYLPTSIEAYGARMDRYESWHIYFAWLPVRVSDNDMRWLEMVERKGTCYGNRSYNTLTYRAIQTA